MGWRRGYTIVELLVVIAITGILAIGGYPQLMGYSHEVRLEQTARMVYEDICALRSACMASRKPGSINFISHNYVAGRAIIRYEMVYPVYATMTPPLFADLDLLDPFGPPQGRYCRSLATNAAGIATTPFPLFYMLASTTNPAIFTLEFNGDGFLTFPIGSMSFPIKHLTKMPPFGLGEAVENPPVLDDNSGNWIISIYSGPGSSTGRVYMRRWP